MVIKDRDTNQKTIGYTYTKNNDRTVEDFYYYYLFQRKRLYFKIEWFNISKLQVHYIKNNIKQFSNQVCISAYFIMLISKLLYIILKFLKGFVMIIDVLS